MLEGLALQKASGALEIDGSPAGTIYLDRGHITFARTSWSPDLGTRLASLLEPATELRELIESADQPDGDLGEILVGRGFVTRDQLQAVLESVVVDAVLVLTVPLTDESSVADIRLESPRAHWAASFHQVRVDAARAQAISTAARLAHFDLPRTAGLELREVSSGRVILTPAQWAVASKINGALNSWDLAWQCGLSLADTFEAVGVLAQSGLCAPSAVADPADDDDDWILPHRRQTTDHAASVAASAAAERGSQQAGESRAAPPPLESLRRVLDGLRRL
ncbi:MAG TPA: DUF4388 domain-containing protein [Streptosporangiaceae bacterium]